MGDGTTSVIILAGEMLSMAQRYVEQNIHPIKIVQGFACALDDAVIFAANVAVPLDIDDKKEIARCVASCLGTKMMGRLESLMTDLAIDAVKTVYTVDKVTARKEIDFKRYAKVEKIPGGEYMDSKVISGVMLNKDVCHPRMKRCVPPLHLAQTETRAGSRTRRVAAWVPEFSDTDGSFRFPPFSIRILSFVRGINGKVSGLRENGESGIGEHGYPVALSFRSSPITPAFFAIFLPLVVHTISIVIL